MSSTVDPVTFDTIAPQPVRTVDGTRMLLRGGQGVVGAASILTALGLWIAPGANWDPELVLLKLLISAVGAMAGVALLQGFVRPAAPKIEVDTIRHEVRLVRFRGKDRFVLDRCAFKDLTRVEDTGTYLKLWGGNGALLAEVAASDRVAHRSLVTALRVAGKL